ncbi:MAG: phosphotransferase [Bacteroidia bacterium]|nr:phosphotransferase [Bacteroidia bacterium]
MNFTLDATQIGEIQSYLQSHKWIAPDEKVISAKIPGEGNMNYTLRIRTNFRTFILKQSRDYVEKYPSIPAPKERAIIEGKFYELIQAKESLKAFTPEINYMDEENSVIMLEDLGESNDFLQIYNKGEVIGLEDFREIMGFIGILHQNFKSTEGLSPLPNREMRKLNAEHIFNYPFMEENGFDLDTITPGLQALAMKYKLDSELKAKVEKLSKYYTEDGNTLLHGDYYPGSWLKTTEGVRVIDPEFCFYGPAEFDISVTLAHLTLAEQGEEIKNKLWELYPPTNNFSQKLAISLAGVEIMRRLIGLAQLPLTLDLDEKAVLLDMAYHMIRD